MATPAKAAERTVLVTGASRGIGRATALRAAADGWAVGVNYARDRAAADAVVRAIRDHGGHAVALAGDVASEDDVRALYARVDAELPPLEGLVNNAGVVAPVARVVDIDRARLERMFAINVHGSFACAREAVRRMTAHGRGGAIVNVSSAAARLGGAAQYVDYAASKGAIESFTVGLAKEVAGAGIRVNAVRPGIIETDIHASGGQPDRVQRMAPELPMRRAGSADEVAEAVVWLLSAKSSYTTGSIVDVAGGR